jgi:hypothetical protein
MRAFVVALSLAAALTGTLARAKALRRPALWAGLVLVGACAGPVAAARATAGAQRAESAARWVKAFNDWEARHGGSDRIVAFVDRGAFGALRVLEVELIWPTPGGAVHTCGWFAIRLPAKPDPGHQIAADGREDCAAFSRSA